MLWEGTRRTLEVVGRMTSDWYIENILHDHVLPYVGRTGYNMFVFMQDKARPHAAGIMTTNYLDAVHIQRLDWPLYSPDLTRIEHMWDQLKRRIRQINPVPNTLEELTA